MDVWSRVFSFLVASQDPATFRGPVAISRDIAHAFLACRDMHVAAAGAVRSTTRLRARVDRPRRSGYAAEVRSSPGAGRCRLRCSSTALSLLPGDVGMFGQPAAQPRRPDGSPDGTVVSTLLPGHLCR